ncbi:MAG: phosphocholine cytidylyltransferase family protein [Bacteroidota bacterium]
MKAIILCAGQGRRLLPYTESTPKCLLSLNGKYFIEWQIDTLQSLGIDKIVAVIGYDALNIQSILTDRYGDYIDIVFNPFYEIADNLASCWMAKEHFFGDIILLNGDTLFESKIVEKLLNENQFSITIATDEKNSYDEDDMKVIAKNSRLVSVGKKLPLAEVNGESIGMIHFNPEGTDLFKKAIEVEMFRQETLGKWYLSIIDLLAKNGNVGVCSISGAEWTEVDFVHDLEIAQSLTERWKTKN